MKKKSTDTKALVLREIRRSIETGAVTTGLTHFHDGDIAAVLPQLNSGERWDLYKLLGDDRFPEIFSYVEDPEEFILDMGNEQAARILENMDSDDAVDILDEVDESTGSAIVGLMEGESREDIELIRSYDDTEIGSLMTTNYIVIDRRMSVKEAMKALVSQAGENDNISTLYVTDSAEGGAYYGAIPLKSLIIAREGTALDSLILTEYPTVGAEEDAESSIERLRAYTEDSFPVLDADGKLIGILTAQDITDEVDEEMSDDYAKLGGLTAEEDLNEGVFVSIRKRIPWLIVLLFLGIGVSTVVGMFEAVVAQLALIVCFQSLILDMAGNVGTQSLAVTIRVLMDEGLTGKQRLRLVWKEVKVGLMNGLLLGLISCLFVGLYIVLAKGYAPAEAFAISGCVGVSLLAAMLISSLVGTVVPMLFHRLKIDPAVASGPLITTVNDLVAVVVYYGLSWVLLINLLHIS